jgi:hypothetical protein
MQILPRLFFGEEQQEHQEATQLWPGRSRATTCWPSTLGSHRRQGPMRPRVFFRCSGTSQSTTWFSPPPSAAPLWMWKMAVRQRTFGATA